MPMVHQPPNVRTTLLIGYNRGTAGPFEVPVYTVYKDDQFDKPLNMTVRFDIDEQANALDIRDLDGIDRSDLDAISRGRDDVLESVLGRAWDRQDPALIQHFEEGLSYDDMAIEEYVLPAARSTGLPVREPDQEPGPSAG